jgi:hypothetical protein
MMRPEPQTTMPGMTPRRPVTRRRSDPRHAEAMLRLMVGAWQTLHPHRSTETILQQNCECDDKMFRRADKRHQRVDLIPRLSKGCQLPFTDTLSRVLLRFDALMHGVVGVLKELLQDAMVCNALERRCWRCIKAGVIFFRYPRAIEPLSLSSSDQATETGSLCCSIPQRR